MTHHHFFDDLLINRNSVSTNIFPFSNIQTVSVTRRGPQALALPPSLAVAAQRLHR
jgi:hypothetical protein